MNVDVQIGDGTIRYVPSGGTCMPPHGVIAIAPKCESAKGRERDRGERDDGEEFGIGYVRASCEKRSRHFASVCLP